MVKQQNIFSLITIYTLYETRLEIEYALLHKKSSLPSLLFYGKKDYYLFSIKKEETTSVCPKREC